MKQVRLPVYQILPELLIRQDIMQLKKYTESVRQQWDSFVETQPASKIYHKIAWKDLIETCFSKETHYWYTEEQGEITAILPLVKFHGKISGKMLISLPFVNYGGMLCSNDNARRALLEKVAEIRNSTNSDAVEIRTDEPEGYSLPQKTNKVTYILDLPDDPDNLNKLFKAKLRSQIRRPQKEGMYARTGGIELLDDYYEVFCRNMRDLGTPVYDKSFFRAICEKLPENIMIVVVYTKEDQPAASAFLIGYKDTMEIPWASSLREFNRFSPNMQLYYTAIEQACRMGYKKFDFGRGTRDGGTYRFKKQWGGREEQLYWYYSLPEGEVLPEVNKENPKFALAIRMWQKLPLPLANFLGPYIIKNLPG